MMKKNILYLTLILILSSCATSKMVVYNGVKMPANEAARLHYAEAEKLYQYKNYAAADEKFKNLINEFKYSDYADNALWRRAQIAELLKQYDSAYVHLQALLQNHPDSDLKYKALYKTGEYALKNNDELLALNYFSKIPLSQVALSRRSFLNNNVEALANKNKDFASLASWHILNFYDVNSSPSYRINIQKKIVDSISQINTIAELNTVVYPDNQNFPKGYLAFQKAKIYLDQENNEQKSKRAFFDFIAQYPNHSYIPKAYSYLKSMGEDSTARHSDETIHIGLMVPLTGPKAHIGQQISKGVILAQDIFQARYPNAPKIKLLIQDTKGEEQQSVIAFEKLMQNEVRPTLVIGPCYENTTQAIEPLLDDYRVPVFSLSSSESINLNNAWLLRNSLTKSEQALGLAYLAKHVLQIKRVAVLYPDNSYGQEFLQLSKAAFKDYNIDLVKHESYQTDQSDLTTAVRKLVGILPHEDRKSEICPDYVAQERTKRWLLKPSTKRCYAKDNLPPIINFEAIFIPDGAQRAKRIFPTLRYYNVSGVTLLGTNLWDTDDFIDHNIKNAAQGSIILSAFYKNKRAPHVQSFVQNFYNKFKSEPGILSAQAYDTASIALSTIFNNPPRSSADLNRSLRQIKNFAGVTGEIYINNNGETRRKLTPLLIDGDKFKELY
ncbi:MAG TPA: penicillin-binding protein activator [Oligoflexia bacterium]|nr:penicillin-binding protein activator [Oligoflexia bacterium]HMR25644.1 penicillin-binding protein activator [Oligoflexia bacterium]